ncbi:MAG: MFS transporter [Bacteriovorax sp.]
MLNITILVVALGYFVDIFDLTLFNMLRIASLKDLGVAPNQLVDVGIMLLNSQMIGMLLGGILWGILGDKKGRLQVLFGSILLYSLANISNAFITTIPMYAFVRFLSGVGLAGELGAGITLITEILPKEKRGLGTALVATIGVLGATFGGAMVEHFSWKTCYIIGGLLGFTLLFLRIKICESTLFENAQKNHNVRFGDFKMLFQSRERFFKFLKCIFAGIPIWFVAGLVMAFSPELAKELKVAGEITAAKSIGISYLGLAFGDFACGMMSQYLRSRLKSMISFQILLVIFVIALFGTARGQSTDYYYTFCFIIGLFAGFWAIFITIAAEQFGTNLRSTVATTVPNFVRGAVIPMTLIFKLLKVHYSLMVSMSIIGAVVMFFAIWSTIKLEETFHKDLNYFEV